MGGIIVAEPYAITCPAILFMLFILSKRLARVPHGQDAHAITRANSVLHCLLSDSPPGSDPLRGLRKPACRSSLIPL